MNNSTKESPKTGREQLCPKCGTQLKLKGKVAESGEYKKWVDEWHCPSHGPVKLSAENE